MNYESEKVKDWEKWEARNEELKDNIQYSSLLIPNIDSFKVGYILNILLSPNRD